MMIIFDFKKRELKEKTQDANFSIPIKNPESAIKKRIPDSDSKIGQKLGGFRIRSANPSIDTKSFIDTLSYLLAQKLEVLLLHLIDWF